MTFSVDYPGNREVIIGLYTNGRTPAEIADYLLIPIAHVRRVIATATEAGRIPSSLDGGRIVPRVRLPRDAARYVRREANRRGVKPAVIVAEIVSRAADRDALAKS